MHISVRLKKHEKDILNEVQKKTGLTTSKIISLLIRIFGVDIVKLYKK